jgi:Zinc finger, C2H2 type
LLILVIFGVLEREMASFMCDRCGRGFDKENHLVMHMKLSKRCNSSPTPEFKCKICFKTFKYRWYLKPHIASVHERQKPFKCDKCGTELGSKRALKIHIRGGKRCAERLVLPPSQPTTTSSAPSNPPPPPQPIPPPIHLPSPQYIMIPITSPNQPLPTPPNQPPLFPFPFSYLHYHQSTLPPNLQSNNIAQ